MRRAATALAVAFGVVLMLGPTTPAQAKAPAHDLTFARVGAVAPGEDCVCILPADVLWTARIGGARRLRPLRACAGRLRLCRASEHAWSQEGKRLAFAIARPYEPTAIRIRLLDRRRGVLRGVSSPERPSPVTDPTWSPDGRRLAVTGTLPGASGPGYAGTAIFVVDVRSGRVRQLTDGPADEAADWSRNGEIAFQRAGAGHDPDDVDVFAVRPDGNGIRRITSGGGFEPDWSPNGRRLAFVRGVGTGEDVFTVAAAGGALRRITDSGWATSPAWSPDGRLIAYEGGGAIHVVRAGGGRSRAIARPDGEHSFDAPAWRPRDARRRPARGMR